MSYKQYILPWASYNTNALQKAKIDEILDENDIADLYECYISGNQTIIRPKHRGTGNMASYGHVNLSSNSSYKTLSAYAYRAVSSNDTRIFYKDYPQYYAILVKGRAMLFGTWTSGQVDKYSVGLFTFDTTNYYSGIYANDSYFQNGMTADNNQSIATHRNTDVHFGIVPMPAFDVDGLVSDEIFQIVYAPSISYNTTFMFDNHEYVPFGNSMCLKLT